MSKVNTAIFFNKYKPNSKGECPVSLKITFQRKRKYYPTVFEFTPDEWKRIHSDRPRGEFKNYLIKLNSIEKKAIDIINSLDPFTWEKFTQRWTNSSNMNTIKDALENKANDLRGRGQVGTAVMAECAINSINTFYPNLKFADITPDLLQRYETWMLEAGKSITTVGMYLREVRAAFNAAIRADVIPKEIYPFGKGKYEIPTGRNIKKALTMAEIARIFDFKSENETTIRMRDYWLFLYMGGGMNVKDFCKLKYKNIKGDVIEYVRSKTARTKREVTPLHVPILPEMQEIIDRYGQPNKSPETYIFPVLKSGLAPEREREVIQLITHLINKHMKRVAKAIGVDKITTYSARHSFATVLKRSGASTEFIGEMLGHADTKTTQNYLNLFEDEEKRKRSESLIPKRPQMKIQKIG